MKYEVVIGLEVHAHLNTKSKVFCSCSTEYGAKPNTNICPVCTGQPGVLPVLNELAVKLLVKTAITLNCRINKDSIFARKQYFYPDLPKNYQISQYELPLAEQGKIEITVNETKKNIGITRIHLEEDAGKLVHSIGSRELDYSLIDYNRTGVPLMEIVSEPDMRSADEAYEYLSALKKVLEYLEVSECNMEEGKFRCDANVSLRPIGQKELGTKAELKNMNSLSGVREALNYEIARQKEILDSGGKIVQETRLWNADKKISMSMRTKEEAHDYRYFPEPDLVPVSLDDKYLSEIKNTIPELAIDKFKRFVSKYSLSGYDAGVLTSDKKLSDFFENTLTNIKNTDIKANAKSVANFVTNELLAKLNQNQAEIKDSKITPLNLAELINLIDSNVISSKIAKTVFEDMFETGDTPSSIVDKKGLVQITDESEIEKFCIEAIESDTKAVEQYKSGKEKAIGALVGFVMQKSKGKANPALVNKILKDKLK